MASVKYRRGWMHTTHQTHPHNTQTDTDTHTHTHTDTVTLTQDAELVSELLLVGARVLEDELLRADEAVLGQAGGWRWRAMVS